MKYSVGGDQSIWGIQRGGNDHRGSEFLFSHIKDDPFFTDYLFSKVVDKLDKGSYELERVYFNGQWSGRESDLHKDGCDITALLYMHNRYEVGKMGCAVERSIQISDRAFLAGLSLTSCR